ncbi:MAG: type II toxin-antitoxin system VapC family toxin [Desulfosalsimonas sp.]
MDWINDLQGKTIGLDTAPLIYFIEENPAYIDRVESFFRGMEHGDFTVVTSTVTLLEVLVQPLRMQQPKIAEEYRDVLLNSNLLTFDFSADISEQAALLRARYNLRTPDAIQISTALKAGATLFFTNDIRLPEIPSIQILFLDSV